MCVCARCVIDPPQVISQTDKAIQGVNTLIFSGLHEHGTLYRQRPIHGWGMEACTEGRKMLENNTHQRRDTLRERGAESSYENDSNTPSSIKDLAISIVVTPVLARYASWNRTSCMQRRGENAGVIKCRSLQGERTNNHSMSCFAGPETDAGGDVGEPDTRSAQAQSCIPCQQIIGIQDCVTAGLAKSIHTMSHGESESTNPHSLPNEKEEEDFVCESEYKQKEHVQ